MNNYYRITAYHPAEDVSAILDSYGFFERLWQFSAFLIEKGFKIISVETGSAFSDGNIARAEPDGEHIILRACAKGMPAINGNTVDVNGKHYTKT